MRSVLLMTRRDLQGMFVAPLAYIVGVPYTVLLGWFFYSSVVDTRSAELGTYFNSFWLLLVVVLPVLGMRCLAEERRSGSLDLLLVRPIRSIEIVFAKFVGVGLTVAVLSLPLVPFLVVAQHLAEPDPGIIGAELLGSALMVVSLSAIAVATSAATQSQLVAAIAAFAIGMVQWFSGSVSGFVPAGFVDTIAMKPHLDSFASGVVSAGDVAFFGTWAAVWLAVAHFEVFVMRSR